jgi:hypothetical protein
MEKKIVFASLGVLALSGGIFFLYRYLVPPKLTFEQSDTLNHNGIYRFGSTTNHFDTNGGGTASSGQLGRNRWALAVHSKDGKSVTFDLIKDGNIEKTLATI